MKILTFDYYERYHENYKSVLTLARTFRDETRSVLFPFWQRDLLSEEQLTGMVNKHIDDFSPDVIIIGDMLNYPASYIHTAVNGRVPVVAFQHGLGENLRHHNENFNCDFYFCWGETHKKKFKKELQERVVNVGLPKLSQITLLKSNFATPSILFLGHADGTSDVVKKFLVDLKQNFIADIKFKPHPEDDFYYENTKTTPYDGKFLSENNINVSLFCGQHMSRLINDARWIIGAGSTAGLKALLLGKPFAVLPSINQSAYPDFLHCNYSADDVYKVWRNQPKDKIFKFLEENVGEEPYKSAEIFYEYLMRIM